MRGRRAAIAATLVFALVAGLTIARALLQLNVAGQPYVPRYGLQDFRDAVYFPVVALLDGHNPYDVADYLARYPVGRKFPLYSPITLLVHLPLGLLPQDAASVAYLVANLLLALVLAATSLSLAGVRATWTGALGLASLVLVSHPGEMTLFVGQPGIYVALGVYLAFHFARSRPVVAGLGLALACLKPTFGVPAALLMLARGDVVAVCAGAAVAAAVSAGVTVFLVAASGGLGAFIGSLQGNLARFGEVPSVTVAESVHRMDVLLVVGRLLGRPLGSVEAVVASLTVLGFAAWTVRRLRAVGGEDAARIEWTVLCIAVLGCCYHQVYDAVLLVLPGVLLVRAIAAGRRDVADVAAVALVGFLATSYFASYAFVDRLQLGETTSRLVTSLNGAALTAALLLIATAVRSIPRPADAKQRSMDALLTCHSTGRMAAHAARSATSEGVEARSRLR
jgi:hypothetical protein